VEPFPISAFNPSYASVHKVRAPRVGEYRRYYNLQSPRKQLVIPAKAGIQYSRAPEFKPRRRGVLDRPVKPDDDSRRCCASIVSSTLRTSPGDDLDLVAAAQGSLGHSHFGTTSSISLMTTPSSSSRVSAEEALETMGEEAVYYHTKLTGASNSRAKAKLGFAPRPLLWKRPGIEVDDAPAIAEPLCT
jgi:hypothetical protein